MPSSASATAKKQANSATNLLFSAYADVDEESESDEESDLDDEKKKLLKENVLKIINSTFDDKESNKKSLLSNIPKGFFDDPSKDYRYQSQLDELEEEKKNESKKAAAQIEKERIKRKREEDFNAKNNDNANGNKDLESDGESENAALNEEISAMIECAEFLGNLTKKEKKRKLLKVSFGDQYRAEDIRNREKVESEHEQQQKEEEDNTCLLRKKRKANDTKNFCQKNNVSSDNESSSVDLDEIINTDFRNIN